MLQDVVKLHQQGDFEQAERGYRELLSFNPSDANVLHLLALARYQLDDHAEAMDLVSQAISIAPDHAEFYSTLANMQLHANQSGDAKQLFEKSLQLDPNLLVAYSGIAKIAMAEGDLKLAEEKLYLAIVAGDERVEVLTSYGSLLVERGATEQGLKYLTRAVEIDPGSAHTQASLGRAYLRNSNFVFAEQALRNSLNIDPQFNISRLLLADVAIAQKQFDKVIELLEPLFAMEGFRARALALAGDSQRAQEQWHTASEFYRQSLATSPDEPKVLQPLAWCFSKLNKPGAALLALQSLLKIEPQNLSALKMQARLAAQTRRWELAQTSLRALLSAEPNDAVASTMLAQVLEDSGQLVQALIHAQAAFAQHPSNSLRLILARAALRNGDGSQAANRLQEIDENQLSATQQSLRARMLGLAADANADFAKAVEFWIQAHQLLAKQSLPNLPVPDGREQAAIDAAQAKPAATSSRGAHAYLVGGPGSGVELVGAMIADAKMKILMDRRNLNSRGDWLDTPERESFLLGVPDDISGGLARRYERSLARIGVEKDAEFVDWLPYFDAATLPALKQVFGDTKLIVVQRSPASMLLSWLAFGSAQGYPCEDLQKCSQFIAAQAAHFALAVQSQLLPVLVLDGDKVKQDPAAAMQEICTFLGLESCAPGAASKSANFWLGGLPNSMRDEQAQKYQAHLPKVS